MDCYGRLEYINNILSVVVDQDLVQIIAKYIAGERSDQLLDHDHQASRTIPINGH